MAVGVGADLCLHSLCDPGGKHADPLWAAPPRMRSRPTSSWLPDFGVLVTAAQPISPAPTLARCPLAWPPAPLGSPDGSGTHGSKNAADIPPA